MIGTILEEQRSFPFTAVSFLLLAAACLAIGLGEHQLAWSIFAILPGTIGVTLLLARRPQFRAEVGAKELLMYSAEASLPYDHFNEVQFVPTGTTGDQGAIHISHQSGVLVIPNGIGVSAADLYLFLVRQVRLPPSVDVLSAIADYYESQLNTFGSERVWIHTLRKPAFVFGQAGKFVGPGMLLTAVAWAIAGGVLHQPEWFVFAFLLACFVAPVWVSGYRRSKKLAFPDDRGWLIIAFFFFPFGLVLYSANRQRSSKKFRDASLVISPAGLALNQAELNGQMRWPELKSVKLRRGSLLRSPIVELRIEGAKIDIVDIYETPLAEIHRQIDRYWRAG
jgi:hypothetical protein